MLTQTRDRRSIRSWRAMPSCIEWSARCRGRRLIRHSGCRSSANGPGGSFRVTIVRIAWRRCGARRSPSPRGFGPRFPVPDQEAASPRCPISRLPAGAHRARTHMAGHPPLGRADGCGPSRSRPTSSRHRHDLIRGLRHRRVHLPAARPCTCGRMSWSDLVTNGCRVGAAQARENPWVLPSARHYCSHTAGARGLLLLHRVRPARRPRLRPGLAP
jgi:hypothetical protein